MTAPSGRNTPKPDAAQIKCTEVLDKLLALSNGGASGELSLVAASQLAADLANDLVVYDAKVRALSAAS
ncbi:MAG: hypothetical protein HY059_19155 [Proteobacteria bacterium]|nr:hypothetical protein [Pseudomonadota bacterium]